MCSPDIFLGLIAILFPPLAGKALSPIGVTRAEDMLMITKVWVKCGICSADSLINICLCMLGYIPGLLHAWYIIAKFPEHDYDALQDAETGRVTYVIVQNSNGTQRRVPQNSVPSNQGYGSTAPIAPPVHQGANGAWSNNAAEGSSGGAVPPSYADAVKGDNKVQTP